MSVFDSRVARVVVYVLMALATLALPIEASQPVHQHHDATPGLYNGECLLSVLAAFHGVAPLPGPVACPSTTLVSSAPLSHATGVIVASLVGTTDPRAPPIL